MERNSSRAITALLVAVISIPFTTQVLVSGHGTASIFGSVIETRAQVLEYQSTQRQLLRRAYSDAMAYYLELVKQGKEDAKKPDINDPMSFKDFIDREEIADVTRRELRLTKPAHASAPDNGKLGKDELDSRQRSLLRSYTRTGSCPRSMENVVPGFFRLCLSIVGQGATRSLPIGYGNDLQTVRSVGTTKQPATLKLRLLMLEQAKHGTHGAAGTGPLRPTPYIGE